MFEHRAEREQRRRRLSLRSEGAQPGAEPRTVRPGLDVMGLGVPGCKPTAVIGRAG